MSKQKISPKKPHVEPLNQVRSPKGFVLSVKFQYILVVLVSFLVYANTLFLDYALDDRLMITDNQFTKKGISGVKDIMTNDAFTGFFGTQKSLVAGGRYRPLTQVMFAVEYQFFGLNPFIGHLINLLLFMAISVLLFHILRRLLAPYARAGWLGSLALISTLLFVVHPIHTEVVANIKGRDELMSLFGSLLALWFAIRYVDKQKILNLLWMFLSFLMAVFSKENSLTFLAIIPLVFYFFYQPSIRQYLFVIGGLAVASMLFLLVRVQVVGGMLNTAIVPEILNDPFLNVPKSTAIATVIYTWGKYLLLTIFPHPLTHDYYPFQIPYFQFSNPLIIFLVLFFIGVVVVAIIGMRKKKLWSFAIWFALITFSIQSNLIFNIGAFMNERFIFVPSIGLVLLIALAAWNLSKNQKFAKGIRIFLILLMLGYSAKTISRNRVWKNDKTLFLTDVKVSSNSIKCNVSAGGMSIEMAKAEPDSSKKQQLVAQGFTYLEKAQKLHSENYYAWFLMGNGYVELSDWQHAYPYFERAYHLNPENKDAVKNLIFLAQITSKKQQYQTSVDVYQILSKIDLANEEYPLMVADGLSHLGKVDSALIIIDRILLQNPKNASAWCKKGEIFGRVKMDLANAEIFLRKSIEINPKDLSANENLGIVYGIKGQFDQSILYFGKALSIDSTQARIYQNLAGTYHAMGNLAKEKECVNKAMQYAVK